ncbi:MAG TPA: DUF4142 domain-containing protein [Flavobacterium sp.]|nr:DUF4142 domain-containing protein [Flavobacterium sp.]
MISLANLKTAILSIAVLCMFTATYSCKSEPKQEDPKEVAEDQNKPQDDATKEKDEQFLMDAAEINYEEIQLSQLALQKGTSADVKTLAQMMVDEHTKALSDLTALAGRKAIAIPTAPTQKVQDAYNNLNNKSGMDFDKEYCDRMVKGHKDAIDKFENASNNAMDAEIKSWAAASLPTLRNHLTHAETCEQKLKDMK